MPKITITEIDETKPGVSSESTDVVYIPGFVNLNQTCLYDNDEKSPTYGEYIGLEANTPTLFTSVAQFETLCGTEPAVFVKAQEYASLYNVSVKDKVPKPAFEVTSFDSTQVLFNAGDSDPAYIMAKELLASGISVMYERVNNDYDYVEVRLSNDIIREKVLSGEDVFFYHNKDDSHTHSFMIYAKEGEPFIPYVFQNVDNPGKIYTVKPDDWEENYSKYYTTSTTGFSGIGYHRFLACPGSDDLFPEVKYLTDPPGDGETYYATNAFIKGSGQDLINVRYMYNALEKVYDVSNEFGIVDRGNYSVKYLTSGGYPTFEYSSSQLSTNTIVTKMLAMAEKRGDCVALIDHTDHISRELNPNKYGSLYNCLTNASVSFGNGDFGAMFTPWATYNRITSDTLQSGQKGTSAFRAPASFAYLTSLADSLKTNANWLAIAGVTRGKVLNVGNMTNKIPNTVADAMQPRTGMSINAITNIKPYGQTIWGNRTLKKNAENLVATSFLNIRNLVSDVKKTCYTAARSITFEQDTDVLWVNFKGLISPLLDRMVSGYGISGYKIVRDTTHPKAKEKATVCARIILYPTYAVEDFYITVVLKDAEVTVE